MAKISSPRCITLPRVLFVIFITCSNLAIAQSNTFPSSGPVGIGTISPSADLQIVDGIPQINLTDSTTSGQWGRGFISFEDISDGTLGQMGFVDVVTKPDALPRLTVANQKGGEVEIETAGTVVLRAPYIEMDSWALDTEVAIQGKVIAKEVEITLDHWADYVFDHDYNLLPLSELESYIKKNKHLPSFPAAADVVGKNVSVGALSAKLTEKIEELTLYVVQLHKRNQQLEQELRKLQAEHAR